MKLLDTLLEATLKVTKDSGISDDDRKNAEISLLQFIKQDGEDLEKFVSSRWQFKLKRVDNSHYDVLYAFEISPSKEGEFLAQDYKLGRYRNKTAYKTPQKAIKAIDIDSNSNWVFRGMSYEEYQNVLKTGFIQSKGDYNFSNQEKLTFFSEAPKTAKYYATNFAPWQYAVTRNRPAVVVAVDKKGALFSKDHEGIPETECAFNKPVPVSSIKKIWFLVVTETDYGELEIIVDKQTKKIKEGSRSTPSSSYVVIEK